MTGHWRAAGVFWPGLACQEPLPRARQKIGIECDLRHRSGEVAVIIFPRRDLEECPHGQAHKMSDPLAPRCTGVGLTEAQLFKEWEGEETSDARPGS